VFLLSLLIFVYVNTLFFTLSLLLVVFALLSQLVLIGSLQTLTVLMLLVVYVGAMIILIGYICAVSPNLTTVSDTALAPFICLMISSFMGIFYYFDFLGITSFYGVSSSPVVFFYTSYGVYLFIVVALALFVTLLIVTSHYSAPKGPFRSVV